MNVLHNIAVRVARTSGANRIRRHELGRIGLFIDYSPLRALWFIEGSRARRLPNRSAVLHGNPNQRQDQNFSDIVCRYRAYHGLYVAPLKALERAYNGYLAGRATYWYLFRFIVLH